MRIGTIVRYKGKQSPSDPIGLVTWTSDKDSECSTVLVKWFKRGTKQWRHTSILEIVCE